MKRHASIIAVSAAFVQEPLFQQGFRVFRAMPRYDYNVVCKADAQG